MRKLMTMLLVLLCTAVAVQADISRGASRSDLPLVLPGPEGTPMEPLPPPIVTKDIKALNDLDALQDQLDKALEVSEGVVLKGMSAAEWRRLADAAVARGAYAQASEAYRREAEVYRRLGDNNAADVEEQKANRYATDVGLYLTRPANDADASRLNTGARLEPALGCYVGAFIDRDDNLKSYHMEGQKYGSVKDFTTLTGRKHASFFMYRRYGEPFPASWVDYVHKHGGIPDIAWEPHGSLDVVQNNEYLQSWVRQARQSNGPIFLRFASEFNGSWVRYNGNPAEYRRAFRTVYNAFRAAPKTALIWCPNTVPRQGLDAYYPGDDAVDWVGVNFYSVKYLDNSRTRPSDFVHPADMVDHIYRRYAARKPMAIGEWAASHRSSLDSADSTDFAEAKIAQFYHTLPGKYPRIKLVNWYNCNNLKHAPSARKLNNFSLTDDDQKLKEYSHQISSPWYLGAAEVEAGGIAPVVTVPLQNGARVDSDFELDAYVRTYVQRPKVVFRVDGKLVHATQHPGRHSIPLGDLSSGRHTVEVLVYDDKNRFITSAKGSVVR